MGRVKPQNIRIVLAIRSPAQSSACRVAERSPLPDLRDKDYEITSRDGPTPRGISILPVIESNLSSWGTDFNRRTQRAQSPIRRPPNRFNASSFAFFASFCKTNPTTVGSRIDASRWLLESLSLRAQAWLLWHWVRLDFVGVAKQLPDPLGQECD